MSISFACASCGKSFTVDDQFAGKNGKCKQCGDVMQIPGSASPTQSAERGVSTSRHVAATSPIRAPREDVYGFDEEPLPPRLTPLANRPDRGGPAVATRPRKKKVGFFGGSKKPKTAGGSSSIALAVMIVLGLVGGFAGLVAVGVVVLVVKSGVVPGGWSTRSQIDAFIKRQVDLTRELTAILRTVTDVPSATAASSRANDAVRKLTQNLKTNKDRKGLQKDIDDLKQKYQFDQRQALQEFTQEIQRLMMIDGALPALAIEGTLRELAVIEQQIPGAGVQAGFTPPTFNPPNIPRPNFSAPPNFNPPPMPGLGPNGPVMGAPPIPPGPPGMPPGSAFPGRRGRIRPGPPGPT